MYSSAMLRVARASGPCRVQLAIRAAQPAPRVFSSLVQGVRPTFLLWLQATVTPLAYAGSFCKPLSAVIISISHAVRVRTSS